MAVYGDKVSIMYVVIDKSYSFQLVIEWGCPVSD